MRPARRGFILATTLLVMTLLTVMLVATFVLISAEFRTTNGSYSTSRSLNLAEAGLQSYFTSAHALSTGRDSTSYTFPGGYASVVAQRLRDSVASTAPALWIVYSRGIDSTRSIVVNGTGQRIAAQFAYMSLGTVPTLAAMVAANGVRFQGPGQQVHMIDGANANLPVTGCTAVLTAGNTTGLLTPKGGYSASAGGDPVGSPGIDSSLLTAGAVNDSTHIDWARLVNGEFTPDNYGTLPAAGNTTYQTHYFAGNVTIPGNTYRGLLVVKGDVTLAANAEWDGIIVAGGKLIPPWGGGNGPTYTIYGALITGLNIVLGQAVARDSLDRNRNAIIQRDWCYTRAAMIGFSYLVPLRGTFADTWKTY